MSEIEGLLVFTFHSMFNRHRRVFSKSMSKWRNLHWWSKPIYLCMCSWIPRDQLYHKWVSSVFFRRTFWLEYGWSHCCLVDWIGIMKWIWTKEKRFAVLILVQFISLSIYLPDIDDCSPNPCQNGGTCTDGVNQYTCACAAGYNGINCTTSEYFSYCVWSGCM